MKYAMQKRAKKACECGGAGCEMCGMAKGGEVKAKKEPESVGKTRSGKDIYPHHKDPRHKGYTREDHEDAMEHHKNAQGPLNHDLHQLGRKHPTSESGFGTPMKTLASKRDYHAKMAQHHSDSMDEPENMAEGGMVGDDDDLVGRIMSKRKGEPMADFESNDFDYMDQIPPIDEADYTGKNSGDEKGDKEVDDEEKDVVSRVMKSRKKGDRMPRPA